MTTWEQLQHHNVDIVAVLVLAIVVGWIATEVKSRIDAKARLNARHLAALRGEDPYAEWDLRAGGMVGGDGFRNR